MKLFTTISLLLITCCLQGQLYLIVGTGYSITKNKPLAELKAGYNFHNILIETGYQAHIDRQNAAVMQAKLGKMFCINSYNSISLTGGYAYHLVSLDDKTENRKTWIGAAAYTHYFDSGLGLYAAYTITHKLHIISAGINYSF